MRRLPRLDDAFAVTQASATMSPAASAPAVTATPAVSVSENALADANIPTAQPAVAPSGQDAAPTRTPPLQLAQAFASQIVSGGVKAQGVATYVAQCSGYGLQIGCDLNQCRPLHTINLAGGS